MKQEIFKINYEKYECTKYQDSNSLSQPNILKKLSFLDEVEYSLNESKKGKKRLVYREDTHHTTQDDYLENYANPLTRVFKRYTMVVVEKDGDKVCVKLYYGYRERLVGNTWFKVSRNVDYITVNIKTGDIYFGYLHNYQNKKKFTRKINKNFFMNEPINTFKLKLRNVLSDYIPNHFEVSMEAISKFMQEIDNREDFEKLDFEKRLFRFYLNKKGIKYPNNFYLYSKLLYGPKIRKTLKKSGNKLVDAVMKEKGLTGKKLKTALHNSTNLNFELYSKSKKLFGDDWINQESDFILNVLNVPYTTYNIQLGFPVEFTDLIGKDELRRVFRLFKRVYFDGVLDSTSFNDHIRMYTELKMYGETDLKWMSDSNSKDFFRDEHLDWSDKIQFYKRGHYERTYPDCLYDIVEKPIGDYYPIVLDNSTMYNEESSIQSNCVKTYIGKPQSIIVSLRNGSPFSDDRATIEYRVTKEGDEIKCDRVQSLGRYNSKLNDHWMKPIFNLDNYLLSFVKDQNFDTVKLTKKCANGTVLQSDSEWDDSGVLRWTYKGIEGLNLSIFDWI
jgi:hypothetical protein